MVAKFHSLIPRQDDLLGLIDTCSCDIILGTETWLPPDTLSIELTFSREFNVYRKDRLGTHGGGVILAAKKAIPSSLIAIKSSLEIVWVTVGFQFKRCIIGVCYRPPHYSAEFIDTLNDALDQVHGKFPNSQLIIGRDFNYPGNGWKTKTANPSCYRKSECSKFIELSNIFQLNQIVSEPTRDESILDLVFTTHPDKSSVYVLERISDHRVVHCPLRMSVDTRDATKKQISNYAKADVDAMAATLNEFLPSYLDQFDKRSANDSWVIFRDKLKSIEDKHIPKITIAPCTRNPWFTVNIRRCPKQNKNVCTGKLCVLARQSTGTHTISSHSCAKKY